MEMPKYAQFTRILMVNTEKCRLIALRLFDVQHEST